MTNRVSHESPQRRLTGVVILHGFTANLESVRELFGPLGRFDLKIASPLLRGHGASSPNELRGVTWTEWLEDAERALETLTGIDGKAVVIGHSMGALLAMQLAARRPELVDSLVLATPPVRLTSLLGPGRPLNFLAPLISHFVDRWNMDTKFADPGNAIMPKQYDWSPTKTILSMFDLLQETLRIAGSVHVPALILHCRNESIVLPQSAEILLRSLGTPPEKKSIVWFEKTDHQIFCDCERKAAVDAAVRFVADRLNHKPLNP
ncbi:alpha/beta hydrolase [Chlorobaculum limnaeum]|uniref:Alpha/beta hydrolase n=1 Tax=Chlorobaculum limnaeum TaxID=274537 RepID=A0A1D8D2R4_CHLLM|nr:alpha/beta hydrolase [Chlorobaculum limnaeum]